MFVLLAVKDTVPVAPKAFDIPAHITIKDALNRKYANRLIADKGMALSIWDLLTAEDGKVTWGNGLMYYKVSFRLMLFSPFHSEVIAGRVLSSCRRYVRITLGFFRDVFVLPASLPANNCFDEAEQRWFWVATEDESELTKEEKLNTPVANRLYIDTGEPIRFRVDSIEYQDIRPPPIVLDPTIELPQEDPYEKAGMRVMGTISESGLGIISWWDTSGEEGEGEEMEGEGEGEGMEEA